MLYEVITLADVGVGESGLVKLGLERGEQGFAPRRGLEAMDLPSQLALDPVPQAALAKLEYAVQVDTMPPNRYLLLHWNGGLSASYNFV